MDDRELAERFQEQRDQLGVVAYRMLGSRSEAEDAVQETWLRLARANVREVENLPGWLRTVVTRICLDMLRSRNSRREDSLDEMPERLAPGGDPADEALLADSVSQALLIVLDTLEPAERIAFVLHDMFAVPFSQIAPIVERTPETAKKIASRARRKVQGTPAVPAGELARNRRVVETFLAAARTADLPGVLSVLAPDVVRHADPAALPPGAATVVTGAEAVAKGTVRLSARSALAEVALVNGTVGAIVALRGRLWIALTFTVEDDKITEYTVISDPARLRGLELAILP